MSRIYKGQELCGALCLVFLFVSNVFGQSTENELLSCSATPDDGRSEFHLGQFIILECTWMKPSIAVNLNNNVTINGTTGPITDKSGNENLDGGKQSAELAWFRQELSGNLSEISASHNTRVKWRLAADDNGVKFICAPMNDSQVLQSPHCAQIPLVSPPEISIISSPGTHYIGESNTFICDAEGLPEIKSYEWFVNGNQIFPHHEDGNEESHVTVDDEFLHRHRHLTIDALNATDNGTQITCRAWTVTNVSNNFTFVLIVSEDHSVKPSILSESVVLIACLSAGGAPVLFLICVCSIWLIRRARKKPSANYDVDYSGSFKSDTDNPTGNDTNTSLPPHFQSNHSHSLGNSSHHGRGTAACAIQRPNFFRQKLNRISQMFFSPMRYTDDESIYENTTPSQTTPLNDLGSGDISRGGSLQLPNRPSLTKMSTVSAPLSASLARRVHDDEQEYENFVPPLREYENTPSILDSPTSPTW